MKIERFEQFFGQSVKHTWLIHNPQIKLTKAEEAKIKEGGKFWLQEGQTGITLGRCISDKGQQGRIFEYAEDSRCVFKIIKAEQRTTYVEDKIKALLEFHNTNPQVCWPMDIVRSANGVFLGYAMRRVNGRDLSHLVRELAKGGMPYFTRKKQLEMIIDILNHLIYLHDKNILVADVKLENIAYDENTFAISMIDMDSVQAGMYNCESTTYGYDAPEVIISRGRDNYNERFEGDGNYKYLGYYAEKYRSLDNEYYAISVLLFRFLMLMFDGGDSPYRADNYDGYENDCSDEDGDVINKLEEDYALNKCIEGDFAYSTDYASTSPYCLGLNIWSHLPSFVKEAFVNTFQKQGGGTVRYSPTEWKAIFERYLELMDNELPAVDPEYNSVDPNDIINYEDVKFSMNMMPVDESEMQEQYGFTTIQAVVKCIKRLKNKALATKLIPEREKVARMLKEFPICEVGDRFRFSIIYNIGVIKKVKLEVLY